MKTFAEIRTAITNDMRLDPGLITSDERDRFVNMALKDISNIQWLIKKATVTATNGVITLPSDFRTLVMILCDGIGLQHIARPGVAVQSTSTGTPRLYYTDASTLRVYPMLETGSTSVLELIYQYIPAALVSAEAKPDIPEGYDDMIIDYAVAHCNRKNGNLGVYREYMNSYNVARQDLSFMLMQRYNALYHTIKDVTDAVAPVPSYELI